MKKKLVLKICAGAFALALSVTGAVTLAAKEGVSIAQDVENAENDLGAAQSVETLTADDATAQTSEVPESAAAADEVEADSSYTITTDGDTAAFEVEMTIPVVVPVYICSCLYQTTDKNVMAKHMNAGNASGDGIIHSYTTKYPDD